MRSIKPSAEAVDKAFKNKGLKKVCILTSSPCVVNNLDSERLKEYFRLNGYMLVDEIKEADLVIVNTCSSRKPWHRDAINLIKRSMNEKNSRAQMLVCGCLPVIDKKALDKVFKGICLDPNSYDYLDNLFNSKVPFSAVPQSFSLGPNVFCVPVTKGCIWNCSYCVIRLARGGRLRSRKAKNIINDIKKALHKGIRAIELQGEDVGSWGVDSRSDFPKLLDRILRIRKQFSINIMRCNPYWLIKYFGRLKKLFLSPKVALISVPIQSGSDRILRRMNRKYRIIELKAVLKAIRETFPNIFLTADIIIGFPGETERDFLKSVEIIREINFDAVYLYKFSRWKNSEAYKYPDFIKEPEIERRYKRLLGESAFASKIAMLNRTHNLPICGTLFMKALSVNQAVKSQ